MTHVVKVLTAIIDDMAADAARDEGLPFTGENVARALGEIRAAVSTLAVITRNIENRTP